MCLVAGTHSPKGHGQHFGWRLFVSSAQKECLLAQSHPMQVIASVSKELQNKFGWENA